MGRVRYARSQRDLEEARSQRADDDTGTVRLLRCVYESDAEVIAAVVPRPLEATPQSEVEVSVAAVEGGLSEKRFAASIGIRVDYDGSAGNLPLAVIVDDEARVIAGRERFGEPRKRGDIAFEAEGEHVFATLARKGTNFLRASGRRETELVPRDEFGCSYSFKAFPSSDAAKDFDHDPQLVRTEWRMEVAEVWRLEGGLELWESPFDPVADLPVRRLVSFDYTVGRFERTSRVLRPVPGDWLAPFLHQRDDAPETEGVDV